MFLTGYNPVVRVVRPVEAGPFKAGQTIVYKMASFGTSHLVVIDTAAFGDVRLHHSDKMVNYVQVGETTPTNPATANGMLQQPKNCPVKLFDGGIMAVMEHVREISNGVEVAFLDGANIDYITDTNNVTAPGSKFESTLYNCDYFDAPYFNYLMRVDSIFDPGNQTSMACPVQFPISTIMDEAVVFPTYKSPTPYEIHVKLAPNNVALKTYAPGMLEQGALHATRFMGSLNVAADAAIGAVPFGNTGMDFMPSEDKFSTLTYYTIDNVRLIAFCLSTDNRGVRDELPLVVWADVTALHKKVGSRSSSFNFSFEWAFSNVSLLKIIPVFRDIDLSQIMYKVPADPAKSRADLADNYYEIGLNPIGDHLGKGAITHYSIDVFGKEFPYMGGCGSLDTATQYNRNYLEMFREFGRYYSKWSMSGDLHQWAMTMGNESKFLGTPHSRWGGATITKQSSTGLDGVITFPSTRGSGDRSLSNPDAENPLWKFCGKFLYEGFITRATVETLTVATTGAARLNIAQMLCPGYIQTETAQLLPAAPGAGIAGSRGIGGLFGIYQNFNTLGGGQHGMLKEMAMGLSAARLPITIRIRRNSDISADVDMFCFITSRRRFVLSAAGTNLDI